jgi:hypothetical protein
VLVKYFGKLGKIFVFVGIEVFEVVLFHWHTLDTLVSSNVFEQLLWRVDVGLAIVDFHQVEHAITVVFGVASLQKDK